MWQPDDHVLLGVTAQALWLPVVAIPAILGILIRKLAVRIWIRTGGDRPELASYDGRRPDFFGN